jgi:hypothetical protein
MERYNEPPGWRGDGDTITVTTAPDSDYWRVTHYGFVRDSGHFGSGSPISPPPPRRRSA